MVAALLFNTQANCGNPSKLRSAQGVINSYDLLNPNRITNCQIFQPVDADTEGLALRAAQSLIRTLYPPPSSSEETLKPDGLVVDIVQDCKKILREPEKSQAQHAIKMLGALVGTTSQYSPVANTFRMPDVH